MRRVWNFVVGTAMVGVVALGVALSSSSGFAVLPPSAGSAYFYNATTNGANDCTGVGGTVGGSFGVAAWKLGSPNRVYISVNHVSPNTSYQVIADDSSCIEHTLGTLVTGATGKGFGSYTFPTTSSGSFILAPPSGTEYQTPKIIF